MPTQLYIQGVTKSFGKKVVLDNISFNVAKGDIFGLIGTNASGKTTLLKTIVGFLRPTHGHLYFESELIHNTPKIEKNFGFAAQESSFYPKLTVEENLEHFGYLYGLNKKQLKENIPKILQTVNLLNTKNMLAENLSGGMQKRLEIACAIIHNPKVLFLDEPTADLDTFKRREILHLIRKINSQGTTIIVASHFLGEVEHLCNRIAIIHQGKILDIGTPEQFREVYSRHKEIHLETVPGKYADLAKLIDRMNLPVSVSILGKKMILQTQNPNYVYQNLINILERNNERVVDLHIRQPSLHEIFESIIKGRE